MAATEDFLFEGAQGVLLDETYGFHPYTTWSTTTPKNAQTLLDEIGYSQPLERLGVLRAYAVRHGPGPFPTEDGDLTALLPPERHNCYGDWQGVFRVGWFDAVLARYAIEVCGGIDSVALTCIDRLNRWSTTCDHSATAGTGVPLCTGYYGHSYTNHALDRLQPMSGEPTIRAQTALGRFLERCSPRMKFLSHVPDLLGRIQQELGVRVSIQSYGPTAVDKVIVSP
jgi:adenylosuccinate synthase